MSLGVVPGNDSSALRRTFSLPLRRSTSLTIRLGGGPFQLPLPRFRGALRRRLSYTGPRACVAVGEGAKARENFYELLGIPESGSFDEIKRAYKLMALKYHPDVSPPDRTEEYTHRFIEVQEAYETLSNPRLRVLYDLDLSRGLHLAFSARRRVDEEQCKHFSRAKDECLILFIPKGSCGRSRNFLWWLGRLVLVYKARHWAGKEAVLHASYNPTTIVGFHGPSGPSADCPFLREVEERSGWKSRWQDQLSVLKRRSREKDSEGAALGMNLLAMSLLLHKVLQCLSTIEPEKGGFLPSAADEEKLCPFLAVADHDKRNFLLLCCRSSPPSEASPGQLLAGPPAPDWSCSRSEQGAFHPLLCRQDLLCDTLAAACRFHLFAAIVQQGLPARTCATAAVSLADADHLLPPGGHLLTPDALVVGFTAGSGEIRR
ncbi:hypothetical protein ZIOFF_012198 [Zingiber officinale]|uniref:J domain-containing protein n=1 Tax=Zingiber officinale TaxID=94328 RepID=A0A8J5LLB4_ZINOF|nr:hypothetical protein ZIOFF_012198 [Zingiber officinale]